METEFYKEKTDKIIPILKDFELPPWDELPKIYLYMDQIIELVSEYFKPFSEFSPFNPFLILSAKSSLASS